MFHPNLDPMILGDRLVQMTLRDIVTLPANLSCIIEISILHFWLTT